MSILDVKEKKLGYDRSKTVKVFRSDAPEVVLCYITAETTVCDVPKKQANSTGKGNSIPVVIFEAMFKAMFEQGIIEVGS